MNIKLGDLLVLGALASTGCVNDAAQPPQSPPQPDLPPASLPAPAAAPPAAPVAAAPAAPPPAAPPPAASTPPTIPAVAQPPYAPPAHPKEPTVTLKADQARGQPKGLQPKEPMRIWIWQTGNGDDWHVRTTTAGVLHRFSGLVWSGGANGTIEGVKPINDELNDRIRVDKGKEIAFDFSTKGDLDGFDFHFNGGKCVHFLIAFDGKPDLKATLLGEKQVTPSSDRFAICR